MEQEIFKAYDIRGIYPDQLDDESAYRIGIAIAEYLGLQEVVVGRDMRLSSPAIRESLVRGMIDKGVNVIDVGRVSTPMVYFAVANYGYSGGIMITASHNPKEYNGFKVCRDQAIPVFGEELQKIGQLAETISFPIPSQTKGDISFKEILSDYKNHVLKFATQIKRLKVIVDASNGMAGTIFPEVFSDLDLEIIGLYMEPDGNFPHHEPNPLKNENLVDLQKKVLETRADLGIAFDGDADRVMFVDEEGQIIGADRITLLIGLELLKNHPAEAIVYDVRSSRIIPEKVSERGGKPVRCRVGHAFMKERMRAERAIFGGELAGHYYFRGNFYADNADIAAVSILNLLSEENKGLAKILEPYQIYYSSGEINREVKDKEAKLKEMAELYKDGEVSFPDGLLVEYPDWWFNLRPSNTEPLLRLNVEARSQAAMERHRDRLLSQIDER
ncbi:MAG: phosphomannomutase/phosphoglucomutase [Nitrospinae bacterium RIFCSPLOWO2_12_FULL_45_22]|nr:MAG: phosphomannomutase/phosphoglucomutase [Nitrospinae bacterium RIFCSPLOWO2_12_FULL_45_22]